MLHWNVQCYWESVLRDEFINEILTCMERSDIQTVFRLSSDKKQFIDELLEFGVDYHVADVTYEELKDATNRNH